jgi:2-polyprenyl-3-methyl-5-hydroxy-6-metoxy-1,4-benzoquinol methylase
MQTQEKSYSRQLIRTGNSPQSSNGLVREGRPWLPQDSNALIVDVGCAWGTLLLGLRQLGYKRLLGIDGDKELAVEAGKRCSSTDGDIRIIHSDAIAFFEQTDLMADCVTMFHVLEHFSPKDGARLLRAIRTHLHPDHGCLVIEVPNMSSIIGMNMQCSDLTHATAFTEFSMKQHLDNSGFEEVSVLCVPPRLRPWRIGRSGSGLGWHANHALHSLLYKVTNSGPRPSCFCPALLVTAK